MERKMTELEKLDAGLAYDFWDQEVNARKLRAIRLCAKLNAMPMDDESAREPVIRELFAKAGSDPSVGTGFNCDYGLHISVGDRFLTNYNVTILDIAPVTVGNDVMIGPNTLISTVNHPLDPLGRRKHLGIAKPVTIGSDVWLGGNVVVLPGVTIGNNVIVAAGAVVTKDVPDNCIVAGVPARKLRDLPNNVQDEDSQG